MKNPPCQSAGGSQKICERFQLFSSFLRGASRPKSPRDTAIAANLFMLERELIVKAKLTGTMTRSPKLAFSRPSERCTKVPVRPVRTAS